MSDGVRPRTVVLVEGESDRVALRTLAARTGRGLDGVEIVAMGGITNTYAHLRRLGPSGCGFAGMYDAAEERHVRAAFARAGLGTLDRDGLAEAGFFACDPDLEHELIRALGIGRVEAVIAAAGESRSLRLLAGMPAQRGWTQAQVLHRFFDSQAGRKARYAALLVEALGPGDVPGPLAAVLARV